MPKVPRPHPIKAVLADRRLTLTAFAPRVGVNPHTFGRVVNGYLVPWPALRRRCAEALDLPAAALWRDPDLEATARHLGIDVSAPEGVEACR